MWSARRVGERLAFMIMAAALACGVTSASAGVAAREVSPTAGWLEGLRWVNTKPLRAGDLAGRVVVVEFWTFDCINCRRTVPAMRQLAATYARAQDVVILGVHTPEFAHEREGASVRRAVERLELNYPVAQDNEYKTWQAFGNRSWPSIFVLDRRGVVRLKHIGELHRGTADWNTVLRSIEELRRSGS